MKTFICGKDVELTNFSVICRGDKPEEVEKASKEIIECFMRNGLIFIKKSEYRKTLDGEYFREIYFGDGNLNTYVC